MLASANQLKIKGATRKLTLSLSTNKTVLDDIHEPVETTSSGTLKYLDKVPQFVTRKSKMAQIMTFPGPILVSEGWSSAGFV